MFDFLMAWFILGGISSCLQYILIERTFNDYKGTLYKKYRNNFIVAQHHNISHTTVIIWSLFFAFLLGPISLVSKIPSFIKDLVEGKPQELHD